MKHSKTEAPELSHVSSLLHALLRQLEHHRRTRSRQRRLRACAANEEVHLRLRLGPAIGAEARFAQCRIDMCPTCRYRRTMAKMIQLRHVPDALHRKLKARAAGEGLSLSDYLIREAERLVERPTMVELRARLASRKPVRPSIPPARAVRIERESH